LRFNLISSKHHALVQIQTRKFARNFVSMQTGILFCQRCSIIIDLVLDQHCIIIEQIMIPSRTPLTLCLEPIGVEMSNNSS
jgi:hypothetical protein